MDEQGIMMSSETTINQSIKGFDEWSRLKYQGRQDNSQKSRQNIRKSNQNLGRVVIRLRRGKDEYV